MKSDLQYWSQKESYKYGLVYERLVGDEIQTRAEYTVPEGCPKVGAEGPLFVLEYSTKKPGGELFIFNMSSKSGDGHYQLRTNTDIFKQFKMKMSYTEEELKLYKILNE